MYGVCGGGNGELRGARVATQSVIPSTHTVRAGSATPSPKHKLKHRQPAGHQCLETINSEEAFTRYALQCAEHFEVENERQGKNK